MLQGRRDAVAPGGTKPTAKDPWPPTSYILCVVWRTPTKRPNFAPSRSHRLVVRSPLFQGGSTGSNPVGSTGALSGRITMTLGERKRARRRAFFVPGCFCRSLEACPSIEVCAPVWSPVVSWGEILVPHKSRRGILCGSTLSCDTRAGSTKRRCWLSCRSFGSTGAYVGQITTTLGERKEPGDGLFSCPDVPRDGVGFLRRPRASARACDRSCL